MEHLEEHLIVDGYNIIGAWPELNRLKQTNLEESRDRLIEIMANYQAYSGMKVIIVFDAHQIPGLGGKYEQSKLRIQYTKAKETADECIERLVVELHHKRRRIYVATSDSIEQHVIFGRGALRLPARELLRNIEKSDKEIQATIKQTNTGKRNSFDSKLSREVKDILEAWRRGK